MRKNVIEVMLGFVYGMIVCAIISLLCGCKTKYVSVPEYHSADTSKMVWRHDSVYLHDSVTVTEYTKGDTVYRDKTKTKYLYKYLMSHDTLTVVRRDSVPYAVERRVTEYKYRQRWYEALACKVGYGVGIFLVSMAIVWAVKRKTQ